MNEPLPPERGLSDAGYLRSITLKNNLVSFDRLYEIADRIEEMQLPIKEAIKKAEDEGLDTMAYINMLHRRLFNQAKELDRLRKKLEAMT